MNTAPLRSFLPPGSRWPLLVGVPECADPALLAAFAGDGHQVYATVSSRTRLAQLRCAAGPGALVDLAQALALPWPTHCLDLCVVPARWHDCLGELLRVLSPGGALIVPRPTAAVRRRLALSGVSWLDQQAGPGGALLAFTQVPAGRPQAAAAARLCCGPLA